MKKIYSYALVALTLASTAASALAEATTADKMCGTYQWRFKSEGADYNDPANKAQLRSVTITLKSGNTVEVKNLAGEGTTVEGTIDAAAGTLTIPRTVMAEVTEEGGSKYTPILELVTYDTSKYTLAPSKDAIVFHFHNGVYVPVDNQGLQVAKYATADAASATATVFRSISNTFWGDIEWVKLGTTTYTDNFFSGNFLSSVPEKTVTVYKGKNVDVFKVEGAFDALGANLNPMLIEAINPDAVHVPVQETGYIHTPYNLTTEQGVKYTGEAWLADAGTLYAGQYASAYCAGSYKNGVITFPAGAGNYNCPNGYDSKYGQSTAHEWTYKSQNSSTLTIPKSSAVESLDSENAPVEYYNLQGVKVANPENGIFIRRQGSKATKVIL